MYQLDLMTFELHHTPKRQPVLAHLLGIIFIWQWLWRMDEERKWSRQTAGGFFLSYKSVAHHRRQIRELSDCLTQCLRCQNGVSTRVGLQQEAGHWRWQKMRGHGSVPQAVTIVTVWHDYSVREMKVRLKYVFITSVDFWSNYMQSVSGSCSLGNTNNETMGSSK